MPENLLYYGDNLDVLRRHIEKESVDLVYLDPPFNSAQDYNVLFKEQSGDRAAAQIKAFEDTWRWDLGAEAAYKEIVEAGGQASVAMQAFRSFLGESDMMAYLAMMAPRLAELRHVLKPSGSIYLHCDPTASHYLKMLMDAVFEPANFKNEIIWKRTSGHSDAKTLGSAHDVILLYAKNANEQKWNKVYQEYGEQYKNSHYRNKTAEGRLFRTSDLTAKGLSGGGYDYEWKGIRRIWRCPPEKMAQWEKEGRIHYTKNGVAEYIRYLDEMKGAPLQDVWTDIPPINSQAQERLGYPTQKPEALLERIVRMGTDDQDTVLDPFCGCGTTIAAAQGLNRAWIGIDITHLAITLMKHRLQDAFGEKVKYRVIGEPVSFPDAEDLAQEDPYQFQWWALGLVHARPTEQKKGADKGIDGRIYFHDEGTGGKTKQIILSVKAGHTGSAHVRDLRGVLDREKAEIGVLISMQAPTPQMKTEAAGVGFYDSPGWKKSYPRLQILTIAELLSGATISMPPLSEVNVTFKKASKTETKQKPQEELDL